MQQLVIISGKGGTGKTVISASFATLATNKVMVDADVDAANLYLLLHPDIKETHIFSGGKKAVVNPATCIQCGTCTDVCQFDAVTQIGEDAAVIDSLSCEGCSVCSHMCPSGAIQMEPANSGEWYVSQTSYGPFVHARLGIGEESSGKLITEIRKKAGEIAETEGKELVIIDGPPGIGCPVIASLSGVDVALVVTEPTLAGIHDMERVIQVARHFNIKAACCINKHDLNPRLSGQIEAWCEKNSIPLMGKISYNSDITQAIIQGIPPSEFKNNQASKEIKHVWQNILRLINLNS